MKIHKSINIEKVMEAVEMDDMLGFCAECGAEACCVEPDARNRKCEACGRNSVFGAEEFLFMLGFEC